MIDFFSFFRTKLEKAKKEQEDRLEYVKEQLEICSHDSKRQIKEITAKVEAQVNNFAADHLTYRSVTYKGYTDHGKKELIQKKTNNQEAGIIQSFHFTGELWQAGWLEPFAISPYIQLFLSTCDRNNCF